MIRERNRLGYLVLVVFALMTTPAYPLNNRSAVSVTGSDAASCTVPNPCRTFGVALANTVANGEVIVLSSGGYGPFSITQSVTVISPPGIYAAIAPTSGDGIDIFASATDKVVLRGLYLNSLGGDFGIYGSTVGYLWVENCVITGFAVDGIRQSTAGGYLFVRDSFFRGNGETGVLAWGTGTGTNTVRASIDHCRFERNVRGVWAYVFSDVTVRDSVVVGNTTSGITAHLNGFADPGRIAVENCDVSMNAIGLEADGSNALMRVEGSTVAYNTIAIQATTSAQITSRVNNTVIDNAAGETFTGTFTAK